MRKLALFVLGIAAICGGVARAQDVVGDWQGTLHSDKDLRLIVRISKSDKDSLSAKMYSIDQGGQAMGASSVTRQGAAIKIALEMIGGVYEGKISADGKLMTGTWTQGQPPKPLPLDLVRVTADTAWDIPAPPAAVKPMAADANPGFDVATIKPNMSGEANLRQLTMNGRNFVLKNGSLGAC
jgi:hypothetical protein